MLRGMMTDPDEPDCPSPRGEPSGIRDLADFHLRWFEFRACAVEASASTALAMQEREVVTWLIRMADRIGDRDLSR